MVCDVNVHLIIVHMYHVCLGSAVQRLSQQDSRVEGKRGLCYGEPAEHQLWCHLLFGRDQETGHCWWVVCPDQGVTLFTISLLSFFFLLLFSPPLLFSTPSLLLSFSPPLLLSSSPPLLLSSSSFFPLLPHPLLLLLLLIPSLRSSGTHNQNIQVYDRVTLNHVCSLTGHIGIVTVLRVTESPVGVYMVSASSDSTVQVSETGAQ